MEELNALLEIKQSRNGQPVPVVNGIHLHSIYNPDKEAQAFASDYTRSIKEKSQVLVLGLGFGYHVREIAKLAAACHKEWKVLVYEPNQELARAFEKTGGFEEENIEIVVANNPADVFEREDFVMFLTGKPAIIKHETSFNLNKNFYREFLTFKAPTKMSEYGHLLNSAAQKWFPVREGSLEQALDSVKTAGRLSDKSEYAFFVLEAVVNSSKRTAGANR